MTSNSKERGMIFNAEMVRAILSGQKTQTRRIVKCDFQEIAGRNDVSLWPWREDCEHAEDYWYPCPHGNVGDRIWVRETWAEAGGNAPELQLYRANYPDHVPSHYENLKPLEEIRWTPSIHMPRWASRILLEITNVRVERLNDISEQDAIAEGIERYSDDGIVYYGPYGKGDCRPERAFSDLWKSIYGNENWEKNQWVWVIEFKRVQEQSND